MKKIATLILFLGPLFLSGCITAGNGLINSTGENVNVHVYLNTGERIERPLMPHEIAGERRHPFNDTGPVYENIVAFDHSGREIGQFNADQVPHSDARKYGKYITFIITDDGVFPVPKRFFDSPEKHVDEIKSFDYTINKTH